MKGGAAQLRARLQADGVIAAPGIFDHVSLLLAEQAGFEALYASGYWGTASALGEPDVGIAGAADFLRIFGGFAQRSTVPVIADGDTGFGSIASLAHAVRGYQRAGIAAMQIEDQPFPKICGHVGRAVSVPAPEMVTRVKVAVEARDDGDMLIIARTDARRTEGLDACIERLAAYGEAGADILFLEAPAGSEEIARAAAALDLPLMINAAQGGANPVLSPQQYADLGVKIVIYPSGAPLAAAQALRTFYGSLKAGNPAPEDAPLFDFAEISRLLGMDDIIALQDRHDLGRHGPGGHSDA